MLLDHERIREFACGCQAIAEENGALVFQRIVEPMAGIYRESEGALLRMECTSGVRLRFRSDTGSVHIRIRPGAETWANQKKRTVLLLVDGEEYGEFGPVGKEVAPLTWAGEVFSGEAGVMREFEFWLRPCGRIDLESLRIDDNARIEPAIALSRRWLAYGDSITQGMVGKKATDPYPARAARTLGIDALNLGVGGAKLDERLAGSVPDGNFELVSIAYGTNDFGASIPPETFQGNAAMLAAALGEKLPGAPVLLITPLLRLDGGEETEDGTRLEDFRAALREVSKKHPAAMVVEGSELLPADADLFADKVHPNERGFAVMAERLIPHIREALDL